MSRQVQGLGGAATVGAVVLLAWACGSSDNHERRPDDSVAGAGAAGEGPTSSGGSKSARSGAAGADTAGADGAGADTAGNGAGGGEPSTSEGGAAASTAGATGEAGAGGAGVDFGEPVTVGAFGCFIRSGDGGDLFPNGSIAVNVDSPLYSAACDSTWVSSNPNGYAPEQTPTELVMRRAFTVDPQLGAGQFSITFKADDAVTMILNGQTVASCTPPVDNLGACQQSCTTTTIPSEALKPVGEVNLLEAHLINLQSVPAGGENWGYTALNYSVCVQAQTQ